MVFQRWEEKDGEVFRTLCRWNEDWWGRNDGWSPEDVESQIARCLHSGKELPQTFVATEDGAWTGMEMNKRVKSGIICIR